jgi:hypothetical protein
MGAARPFLQAGKCGLGRIAVRPQTVGPRSARNSSRLERLNLSGLAGRKGFNARVPGIMGLSWGNPNHPAEGRQHGKGSSWCPRSVCVACDRVRAGVRARPRLERARPHCQRAFAARSRPHGKRSHRYQPDRHRQRPHRDEPDGHRQRPHRDEHSVHGYGRNRVIAVDGCLGAFGVPSGKLHLLGFLRLVVRNRR